MTYYIKAMVSIFITMLMAQPFQIHAQERSNLEGVWAGVGTQPDGSFWTVVINLSGDNGVINYDTIPCAGTLKKIDAGDNVHKYRERITKFTKNCIDNGTLYLKPFGQARLHFQWHHPDGRPGSSAILTRYDRETDGQAAAERLFKQAKQGLEPGWIVDEASGCKVWNSNPKLGETITYTGSCPTGVAEGPGVVRWYKNGQPNGRAEGSYRNGRLEGKGLYSGSDGFRYDGDWSDDKMTGKGTYTWSNGSRYEGDSSDGVLLGKGVYTWSNGSRYEGEWSGNKRNGFGVMRLVRGDDAISGYGSYGSWQGDLFVVRGMWSDNNLERECATEKDCQAQIEAERERERQEEARKARCEHLYVGKVVEAPTKSWLFGSGNEQAIVLGFSSSQGVATVKSTSNSSMVGEVPCWSLK